MKKAFIAVGLVVALSSCAATDTTVEKVSSTPSSSRVAVEEGVKETANSEVAKIGDTWKYESGLEVTIVKIKRVKISQYYRASYPNSEGAIITASILNGTDSLFDSSLATMNVQHGAEGEEAEQVFDSENNESADGFSAKIQKGKKATAKFEFAIPKTKTDLNITFEADWSSEPAQFTGKI